MAIISTLVVALTARTTDFERGLKSVEKSLDRTGDRAEALGGRLAAGLTAPLTALGAAAGKLALDFNEPFDKMQAILGQSAAETDGLRESVLKLAGQTAQAPKDLGAALYDVETAGIRGAQALDVLKAAAQASAIGLGSTKAVASFLTAELNAYGPSAMSAASATSVLIEAARVGRLKIEDLTSSVGAILPIAAQTGVSFDQVAAAISVMTRSGLEAGQATMGLRTILETLEKPSASVQKALAMVGLSAAALKDELKTRGLLATLGTLKDAFEGNDEAMAQVFPNARTFAGVLSLMGERSEATEGIFRRFAATTTDTLGAAFRKAASDDSFKFQQALVAIQAAFIRLGNDLLPIVVPLVERFTKAVTELSGWFEHLSTGGKDLAVVLLSVVAAVGPLLLAFGSLYSAAATALGVLRLFLGVTGLGNLFSAAAVGARLLAAAVGELVGYFAAFGAAETIAGVVLPALASSALLAGGLMAVAAYLWISKWQELKTDMGLIVDYVVDKLDVLNRATRGFADVVNVALNPALAVLVAMRPAVAAGLGGAADAAAAAGAKLKTGFLAEVAALETGVGDTLTRLLARAQGLAAGVVGTMKGVGGALPPVPAGPAGPALGASQADIQQQISLWTSLGATLKAQGDVMDVTLGAFKENALEAAATFKAQVKSMVGATEQSMGAMTAAFLKGKESLSQFVNDMMEAIAKLIAKILLLKALTAAGLGGPFAAGFVGGMFAEGGRPPVGKASIVGEKGPELFVPDTAGTVVPNSALGGGGGGTSVTVVQTVQIDGLDLGSADAARKLAVGLKDAARSGAAEGVALSLQIAQTAAKNAGRAV